MTAELPASTAAEMTNAAGGGAATPYATSGDRTAPITQKEILMLNDTPARPWLESATAEHLTPADLARLDRDFAACTSLPEEDLVDYIRGCAEDQARVRKIIGPHDVPLPKFVETDQSTPWELTDDRTDAVRTLHATYADRNDLGATLEVDQYAISPRMDFRVHIAEGTTEDPAELVRWSADLLALANRWIAIARGRA